MFDKVILELNIKLDEAVHRYRYTPSFYHHDLEKKKFSWHLTIQDSQLYPYMCKSRVKRL